MGVESTGQWLEKALTELCQKMETGIQLDGEIISGLVSYCEMAPPLDAKEYLDNIIGEEAGKSVIDEYLKRRGHSYVYDTSRDAPTSSLQAYVKPRPDEGPSVISKKAQRAPKEAKPSTSTSQENRTKHEPAEPRDGKTVNQASSKKKKSGKVISLAEAAKGSIVFQKGKPCICQARRHALVSNCISCGKIVCEQEGEGPCNFCGALVLREGSTYAGLDEGVVMALTDAEAAAEAYAKRLVEYDRNAAARTTVIDDQSDYYEMEGNSWLSNEEKELLRKKREEIEEAERSKRSKVVMTFDLLGRKVLMNEDEASEEMQSRILLRQPEKEDNRIKPNPHLKIQPIFIDPGPRKPKDRTSNKGVSTSLCLEISGRVQHGTNELNVL